MLARTPAISSGIRIFPPVASASHLPDALIHSAPSSFREMFPVLACVSSGLRPTRPAKSSSGPRSPLIPTLFIISVHSLQALGGSHALRHPLLAQNSQPFWNRRHFLGPLRPHLPDSYRSFKDRQ